jgi:hypothetical protein
MNHTLIASKSKIFVSKLDFGLVWISLSRAYFGLSSDISASRPVWEKKITFAVLQVTRTPYVFPILPFRKLSSGRYKNEKL